MLLTVDLIAVFGAVGPGDRCNENEVWPQCTGNSVCANGYCTCPTGERIINGICTALDTHGRDNRYTWTFCVYRVEYVS